MNSPQFDFNEPFGDARVAELRLLSWIERNAKTTVPPLPDGAWRDLVLALISHDFLTTFSYEQAKEYFRSLGHGSSPAMAMGAGIPGETRLERAAVLWRVSALEQVHEGASVTFRLTHLGRVRSSELKQELRTGREREPLGILWDARHWEQDLQIVLFDASAESPVSVAYMDMNGLKGLNDRLGHDAGDRGLRAYFQAVASIVDEAYRLAGDEVLAIFHRISAEAAAKRIAIACQRLMEGSVLDPTIKTPLSIAVGIVSTTDPAARPSEIRTMADKVQYRAKEASKKAVPRPSVVAVQGVDEMITLPSTDVPISVAEPTR